METILFLGAKY